MLKLFLWVFLIPVIDSLADLVPMLNRVLCDWNYPVVIFRRYVW